MHTPDIKARPIAKLYHGHYQRGYVTGKIWTDPLYPAVSALLLPLETPLLDMGCGMGVFAFCLRQQGWKAPILGVDVDERKIKEAQRICAEQQWNDTIFRTIDIREGFPDHAGSVTILDVLQYLRPEQQETLLCDAAARVVSGGVLIIRSGMESEGWRYKLTRLGDLLGEWTGWMQEKAAWYPNPTRLHEILSAQGLVGEVKPLWGYTPFNNWLAAYRRP